MWLDRAATALLLAVGAVNLLPGLVAFAPSRIATAYGVPVDGPGSADLTVLLRHRAVLLGPVGLALVGAAFLPPLTVPAVVAGTASMGSFLLFAYLTPGLGGATARVTRIDAAALTLLAVAAVLLWRRDGG
ncbi:hypothetical protein V1L54_09745 [Streptomyces sp. TRM 70361]|uniref:hypothetical protein n=1 Tax=Streptomyces sp. TRM 70361 TaxID=3116553 RepID=UPI002E7B435E|nr:hypothetical protein [Streptomyces sp. TRM 70361]MEE1939693.1 hypothetical protein [Streptomyces sp. TRM 70361]